jgi:hypothetical protein
LQALTDEEIMSRMRIVVVFEYDAVEPGSSNDEGITLNILTRLTELEEQFKASNVFIREIKFEE